MYHIFFIALEKEMATHSSFLPWMEEPGGLQSMGSQRLRHDWAIFTYIYLSISHVSSSCGSAGKESACNAGDLGSIFGLRRSPGEGKGYPLQYSGLENPMDYIVHGVTKSQTRLSNFHFHFFIHSSKDIYIVSMSWLLWIVLLQTQGCLYPFWIWLLSICMPRSGITGSHWTVLFFLEIPYSSPWWLHQLYSHQ